MAWKEWGGYYAACSYETTHEFEYFAFRHAAGLLDATPLFKYDVRGQDAAAFLSRVMVKDISRLRIGRVAYVCWCTDQGKIVDDGTVMRLEEDRFFVTASEPNYAWFKSLSRRYDVDITDITDTVCALALQGPTSRDILRQCCDADLDHLRYFDVTQTSIDGRPVQLSRTGYTGDLGFEIFMTNNHALPVWDAITSAGALYNLLPAGLDALDMTRIEAGLILNGVDYFNGAHVLTGDRMSSPFELPLGWMVDLDRDPFVGQRALRREKRHGSSWSTVGLEISWPDVETLYHRHGLPPQVPGRAWRSSVPLFRSGRQRQIGYATSGTWSPTLKKYIALATIQSAYAHPGNKIGFEITVEHVHYTVSATVCNNQFYNPPRKRSTPASDG